MRPYYWQILFGSLLFCIYWLLFYFILTDQYKIDFSSLYSAISALKRGDNPYQYLVATYLPQMELLPINLNPPFVLWLLTPIMHFDYHSALIIWSAISFISGLIGAEIAFNYTFSAAFLKKNRVNLYLIYLALFSTLTNTAVVQLGSILLFFIMLGYHFYHKKRHFLAGTLWGLIIAIKLFPGLLFFYVLKEQRFKVFIIMLIVFLLSCFIPLLTYGFTVYKQYYLMMTHVFWYGESWNASLYGFIFRFFAKNITHYSLLIKFLYSLLFLIALFWYLNTLNLDNNKQPNYQFFCLTLVMMLVLSPFGWLYYFPLLISPLSLSWLSGLNEEKSLKGILLWSLCLFLINFPLTSISANNMSGILSQISVFSFHFYGLLLLMHLIVQNKRTAAQEVIINERTVHAFVPILLIILTLGLILPIHSFLMHLSQ
ncbi:glycosyltransferase family 87 protein [Legionella fairfieldensis]|uniref:glycosyltransferase family 87 protein n=1 Tax=Legionella fairfieldensis TaxID=45064 RepID=UPI00048DEBE1|nr:glycosyltransferase family 87 protein [Legionella fairfieldensis]